MPTVYVHADSTLGSDSNAGTGAAPYLTLNKAVFAALTWLNVDLGGGAYNTGDYEIVVGGTFVQQSILLSGNHPNAGSFTYTATRPGQRLVIRAPRASDGLTDARWNQPPILDGARKLTAANVGTIANADGNNANFAFTFASGAPAVAAQFTHLGIYGTASNGETRVWWFQRDTTDADPGATPLLHTFRYNSGTGKVTFPKTGWSGSPTAPANTGLIVCDYNRTAIEAYGSALAVKGIKIVNYYNGRGVAAYACTDLTVDDTAVDGCIEHAITASNGSEPINALIRRCSTRNLWRNDTGGAFYAFSSSSESINVTIEDPTHLHTAPRSSNLGVLGKDGIALLTFILYGNSSGAGNGSVIVRRPNVQAIYGYCGGTSGAKFSASTMEYTNLVVRASNTSTATDIRKPVKGDPTTNDVQFIDGQFIGLARWSQNRSASGTGFSAGPSASFLRCLIRYDNAGKAKAAGNTSGPYHFENADRATSWLQFINCIEEYSMDGVLASGSAYDSPAVFARDIIATNGETDPMSKAGGWMYHKNCRIRMYGAVGKHASKPCLYGGPADSVWDTEDKMGWRGEFDWCEIIHDHGPAADPNNTQWTNRPYPRLTTSGDYRSDIGTGIVFTNCTFVGFIPGYQTGDGAARSNAAVVGSFDTDARKPTWQGASISPDVRELVNFVTQLGNGNKIAAVGSSGGTLLDGTPVGPSGISALVGRVDRLSR